MVEDLWSMSQNFVPCLAQLDATPTVYDWSNLQNVSWNCKLDILCEMRLWSMFMQNVSAFVFFSLFSFFLSEMGNTGLSIYRHTVCLSVYTPILSVYTFNWSAYIRLYWAYIRYPSQHSVTCFEDDQLTATSAKNGRIHAQTERIYAQNGRI